LKNHAITTVSYKPENKPSGELILIQNLLKSEFANVIKYYYNGNFSEVLRLLSKERLQYLSNLLYL